MANNEEKPFIETLGKIVAITMIVVYLVELANAIWAFIPAEGWGIYVSNAMAFLKQWGALILVGIVALQTVQDQNILIKLLVYAAIAIIVIAWFFPDVYQNLLSYIPTGDTPAAE